MNKYIKYPLLNNKEWLYQKYVIEEMSALKIALIFKVTNEIVLRCLKRHNIKIRTYKEARDINCGCRYFNIDKSVLEGGLLGDACLYKNKNKTKCYPKYIRTNVHKEHIEYIYNIFELNNNIEYYKPTNYCINGKTGITNGSYRMTSPPSQHLISFYNNWYPEYNNYKKVIPKNINIDSIVLLHWFLDDGCSWYESGYKNKKCMYVKIRLCSQCFIKEDQEWLCEQFNNKFDLGMKVYKCNNGTGWLIGIPPSKSDQFFKTIGKCPIDCMQYKWKTTIFD